MLAINNYSTSKLNFLENVKELEKQQQQLSISKNIIIINPCALGGSGDSEYGKKLKDRFIRNNHNVSLIKFDIELNFKLSTKQLETIFDLQTKNKLALMTNPIITIIPINLINNPNDIATIIEHINRITKVDYSKLLLITETHARIVSDDLNENFQDASAYTEKCKNLTKVNSIFFCSLGFANNQYGYIPLEAKEIKNIQENATFALKNLESNLSININQQNCFLGYINDRYSSLRSTYLFLYNTQVRLITNNLTSCYFMIYAFLGDNEQSFLTKLMTKIKKCRAITTHTKNIFLYNNPQLTLLNTFDSITTTLEKHIINFYIMDKQPKDVFYALMLKSIDAITTGDHSFAEYLSLKQTIPYYELQEWKQDLCITLMEKAEEFGGEPLKNYLLSKILGRNYKSKKADANESLIVGLDKLTDYLVDQNALAAIEKYILQPNYKH